MTPPLFIVLSALFVIFSVLFMPFCFGLLEWFWDKQIDLIRKWRKPKEPK